jgi:hypothetical protein
VGPTGSLGPCPPELFLPQMNRILHDFCQVVCCRYKQLAKSTVSPDTVKRAKVAGCQSQRRQMSLTRIVESESNTVEEQVLSVRALLGQITAKI